MYTLTTKYIDFFLSHSNPLGSLLTRAFFSRTEFKNDDREKLTAALDGATPLYIMRTSNDLDFLLFLSFLRREGLAEPAHVLPGESLLLRPVNGLTEMAAKLMLGLGEDHKAKLLADSVLRGSPAMLTLFSSGDLFNPEERPRATRGLYHLVNNLRETPGAAKVRAIPVIPVWDKSGARRSLDEWAIIEKYLGSQESPGRARALIQMAAAMFKPVLKIGDPIDLNAYIAEHEEESVSQLTTSLRLNLLNAIERSWQTILGPRLPNTEKTRRELARNPKVIDSYFQAVDEGLTPKQALKEIREAIKEIPAAPTSTTLALYKHTLRFLWYRIFKGFELHDEGFERMREAQQNGPLLLLPCHRSHIDYLILSWLMDRYHLPIPHIAAGQNLSFFPMGPIFRRGGAFFIKRTFKGNKLYKSVLLEYLARLFNEGINVEFFPEGTRSRTGKAVYPKQGLLSMIGELLVEGAIPSPQIVPISIGYEKVIEENAYQAELKGSAKKSEDFMQVIKAGKVILNRYGRVNIQVARPFDMKKFMGDVKAGTPLFAQRIEELALTIIADIIKETLITSSMLTASALLAPGEERLEKAEVFARYLFFRRVALDMGANLSTSIADERELLRRFNRSLKGFEQVVRTEGSKLIVPPSGRSRLAYYRNGYVQVVAPTALYALATTFGTGSYIMHSYLWEALSREFPQLNLLDHEESRKTQAAYLDPIVDSSKRYLGLLLPDLIEGQVVALEAMVKQLSTKESLPKKQLMSAIISHGEEQLGHNRIHRPEACNRSLYQEALQQMVEKGLISFGEKGLQCTPEQVNELSLELEARRGILKELDGLL